MAGFIGDIIQNSLSSLVSGAVATAGAYTGSAVNGVGSLIEGAGSAVGNGVAKFPQSVGHSISSYGASVQSASAQNSRNASGIKIADPKSKPSGATASRVGGQKALPSTAEGKTQRAPSSTTTLKALEARASTALVKKNFTKAKSTYQPPSPTSSSLKPASNLYRAPKSLVAPLRSAVGAAANKSEPTKRLLSSGKVVASKASLSSAGQTPSNLPAANAPPFRARADRSLVNQATSEASRMKQYAGQVPHFKGVSKAPPVTGSGFKASLKGGSVADGLEFF